MGEPVVVNENAGLLNSLAAAGRYIAVVIGFIIAVLGLFKTRDIAGLIAYIQTHGGELLAAIAGLVSLGTAAYGIFKTKQTGDNLVTVAASSEVPNHVAQIKE